MTNYSRNTVTSRGNHLAAFGLSKLKIILLLLLNSSIYLAHILRLLIHSNSVESSWILYLMLVNLVLIYIANHVISCIIILLEVLHLFRLAFAETDAKLWSTGISTKNFNWSISEWRQNRFRCILLSIWSSLIWILLLIWI